MKSKIENLIGKVLIASPYMRDSCFSNSVVLVVDRTNGSTTGLIVNKCTETPLSQIWQEIGGACNTKKHLFFGGPCQGPMNAIHQFETLSNHKVDNGLYWSLNANVLKTLVQQDDNTPYRVFIGYAGWQPGQLETEMNQGGWLVAPASQEIIFSDPSTIWKNSLDKLANDIYRSVGIEPIPDPSVN